MPAQHTFSTDQLNVMDLVTFSHYENVFTNFIVMVTINFESLSHSTDSNHYYYYSCAKIKWAHKYLSQFLSSLLFCSFDQSKWVSVFNMFHIQNYSKTAEKKNLRKIRLIQESSKSANQMNVKLMSCQKANHFQELVYESRILFFSSSSLYCSLM